MGRIKKSIQSFKLREGVELTGKGELWHTKEEAEDGLVIYIYLTFSKSGSNIWSTNYYWFWAEMKIINISLPHTRPRSGRQ